MDCVSFAIYYYLGDMILAPPVDDIFCSAKWLPANLASCLDLSKSDNLLDLLGDAWQEISGRAPSRHATRFREWLEQQRAAGAKLTINRSWNRGEEHSLDDLWLSPRFCWWPNGIPDGKWTAIVSSRLGRRLDLRNEWFEFFREACTRIDAQQEVLLAAERTTTARFAERAADLFGLRMLMVQRPRPGGSLSDWFRIIRRTKYPAANRRTFHAVLSPSLDSQMTNEDDSLGKLPLSDRVTIAWADRIFVPHLRRAGNLEWLVRARLQDVAHAARVRQDCTRAACTTHRAPEVHLAIGPRLVPHDLADELLKLGAKEWGLSHDESPEIKATCSPIDSLPQCPVHNSGQVSLFETPSDGWRFLTHCTRGAFGPWPEQSEAEYLNELIEERHPTERSPFNSLLRILQQQRIVASVAALRGGVPAVCFTAVPLPDLHRLRTYQPQRQCWDFEPYGICIRREWLMKQGARAVIYGDDADWQSLSETDRPFFQRRQTRRGRRRRDWSREQEWRHLGNVDLSQVPADSALVFASNLEEAAQLARLSRWPVTVCR
jgi:hypothetical protein